MVLWRVPGREERQFVDVQRDATSPTSRARSARGMRSVEHIKRYTTTGTAHDQGKTSGVIAAGITAELLGVPIDDLGTTTSGRPIRRSRSARWPAATAARCSTPCGSPPLHDWHVAHGAVFEDVGQWKRPRYYPLAGEDMDAAVLRECAAARDGVGILDGSTLGKIDVQGPRRGRLLDRIYTNLMSSLKVGSLPLRRDVRRRRHGVRRRHRACALAEDRFLVTTTTGNAAQVLDWMEEWLQTEWPDLRCPLYLGDRAMGHVRRGRARARATSSARCSPRPRRSQRGASRS